MSIRKKDKDGVFKNIFIAYFILLLHVFLLALAIAWIVYHRMRETSSSLSEVLGMPEFQDRAVEIRLLGGLASFEIKAKEHPLLPNATSLCPYSDDRLIESAGDRAERKMLELNGLYEKDLISKKEFEKARQKIIQG
jgi:hypothetical protein